ncbi:HAD family hydrolase [Sphingorhabdus sp. IMCC26285]|uniref:HAD family hydrolase n=1 Tax=Sphingorhabdus profundilacus TaxID=2509718 RepID=A0A6I4LYJ7_9SPHN|nr:HAD family hydrolase [Sphingorhabdus profundilacus]
MTARLAIFDCDGTLVDSQANICLAMEYTFEQAGMPPPARNAIRRVVGLSLFEIMRVLLPNADSIKHTKMVELYRASYLALRNDGLEHEPLYDGMAGLLASMDESGWLLGVATGKSDRGLERCLDHHAIKGLFVTLQTADRHPSKPHPSMVHQALADADVAAGRAVVIGDTVYDIQMGRAAGTRTIGVNWGYHPVEELRAAGADAIAESMDELAALLGDFV